MIEKKIALREKVLSYTLYQFINSGYRSINMDNIAHTLGVSKRTLYEMFVSKDDMIIESIKSEISIFKGELDRIALIMLKNDLNNFFENLYEMIRVVAKYTILFGDNFVQELRTHLPKIFVSDFYNQDERFDNMIKVFELGKKKGYFYNDINSELLLQVIQFSLRNILKNGTINYIPLKAEDIIKQVFRIIFAGAMTPDTINRFIENTKCENNN